MEVLEQDQNQELSISDDANENQATNANRRERVKTMSEQSFQNNIINTPGNVPSSHHGHINRSKENTSSANIIDQQLSKSIAIKNDQKYFEYNEKVIKEFPPERYKEIVVSSKLLYFLNNFYFF